MKHKTDKNHFDHQRHFAHFLWASNRGRQLYDMSIVQDDKKLGFQKKKPSLKKIWVLKKNTLSFENIWVFLKKNPECWKNLTLKKTVSFEKIWVLKNVLK